LLSIDVEWPATIWMKDAIDRYAVVGHDTIKHNGAAGLPE
jgi:hypothetical protein